MQISHRARPPKCQDHVAHVTAGTLVECRHDWIVLRDAATPRRQLYEVLAAKGVAGRRLPVLLVANKADQGAKAHTPDFVRRRLEREL
jgi:hypothetical protein